MLDHRRRRQPLSRRAASVLAVSAAVLIASAAAVRGGQDGPQALAGTVYDPSGAVMPEVALTLIDDRENRWQTTSDSAGRFEFPAVGAGTYRLGASLAGFRALDQELILRDRGDWNRAVTLQVGEVSERVSVRAARPAPRPGGAAASAPSPVRVGGNIKPPTRLHDVAPIYPPSMQEAGLEGVVPIEAVIAKDGNVASARIQSSQVHPDFANAALDAVRQWRFSPTLLNGRPVEVRVSVNVEFSLDD